MNHFNGCSITLKSFPPPELDQSRLTKMACFTVVINQMLINLKDSLQAGVCNFVHLRQNTQRGRMGFIDTTAINLTSSF